MHAAGTAVIGTDDPQLYPDKVVLKNVALTSGTHAAITSIPISANTGTAAAFLTTVYGHTPNVSTVSYYAIISATGAIGTASVAPIAAAAGMSTNTSDSASVVDLVVFN